MESADYVILYVRDHDGISDLCDCRYGAKAAVCGQAGEVVGKIVYLRLTYHFGPQKISMYLKRYHDIQLVTERRCIRSRPRADVLETEELGLLRVKSNDPL